MMNITELLNAAKLYKQWICEEYETEKEECGYVEPETQNRLDVIDHDIERLTYLEKYYRLDVLKQEEQEAFNKYMEAYGNNAPETKELGEKYVEATKAVNRQQQEINNQYK
ncbi:MAG: hypothetical protein UIM53_02815 [Acutalibacteraceae bacterium]|nr:hypothetical protein [Acutalibacteraceae bacterium]